MRALVQLAKVCMMSFFAHTAHFLFAHHKTNELSEMF